MTEAYAPNDCFVILAGKRYLPGGSLTFPTPPVPHSVDRFYRTHFGYRVPHSGVVYAKSDHNTSLALRRLMGKRLPDIPGAEEELQAANIEHFTVTMRPVLKLLASRYRPYFQDYQGMREEARLHHADPHPKSALRIRAYTELVTSGQIANRHWARTWRGQLIAEGKMKTEEYAKPGKKPRMIVDLGVAASLQGFRIAEFLKQAQSSEPLYYKGGIIQFIKDPSPHVLRRVFHELISPSMRFYYCYFSDDACYSVHTSNGVFSANIDISSCDASHTHALFDALVSLVPHHAADDMRVLVEQCTYALKIRSVANRKVKVVIKPKTPRLYSGSTITTPINNVANIGIAVAIVDAVATSPDAISLAARTAGYIVTVDHATIPEQLQFLKHSPVKDSSGEYQPLINLGVIIRLSGTCKRDLPGRGPLSERARQFQQALLTGLCPGVSFPWLDRMRARAAGPVSSEFVTAVARQLDLHPTGRIIASAPVKFDDAAVFRRYSSNPGFHQQLDMLTLVGFEEQVGNDAIAHVLALDYGLTINRSGPPLRSPTTLLPLTTSAQYTLYRDERVPLAVTYRPHL